MMIDGIARNDEILLWPYGALVRDAARARKREHVVSERDVRCQGIPVENAVGLGAPDDQ